MRDRRFVSVDDYMECLRAAGDATVSFSATDSNRLICRPKDSVAVLASAAKMTSAVFHFLPVAIGAAFHGSRPIESVLTVKILTATVEV